MKLIDADKLRQHVLDNWEMERHGGTDASGIRAEVWAELNDSLQSGTFDPTPVQPDTPNEIDRKAYENAEKKGWIK